MTNNSLGVSGMQGVSIILLSVTIETRFIKWSDVVDNFLAIILCLYYKRKCQCSNEKKQWLIHNNQRCGLTKAAS